MDMHEVFEVKTDDPNVYVGLHIIRDRQVRTISLHHAIYIDGKLKKYGLFDSAPCAIPADSTVYLQDQSTITDDHFEPSFPYKATHGSLGFAAQSTRPDISFATSNVGRFQANPTVEHCKAARKVFKYLRGTIGFGITYGGSNSNCTLTAYGDADFANDKLDRKSRSGWVVLLNNGPIAWGSNKKALVATSTCYAEYIAIFDVTKVVVWLRRLMASIGQWAFAVFTNSNPL